MQLALPLPADPVAGSDSASVAPHAGAAGSSPRAPGPSGGVPRSAAVTDDLRPRLRAAWTAGDAEGTGRALAAALPIEARPAWGAAVLALLAPLAATPISGVTIALALAGERTRWPEAHDRALALGALRRRAVRTHGATAPRTLLLGMAECVAQLAYAAAGGVAPFEGDAAARLTTLARRAVERAHDPALEARAWRTLAAHLQPVTSPGAPDGDGT